MKSWGLLLLAHCVSARVHKISAGKLGSTTREDPVGFDHIGKYTNDAYTTSKGDLSNKFFNPVSLTTSYWSKYEGSSFNPSIVALPAAMAKELHSEARFASSARFNSAQCVNFGRGETANMKEGGVYSSILILDKDFRTLLASDMRGEDLRLFILNDQLLLSWTEVPRALNYWQLAGLELGMQDNKFVAKYADLHLPGTNESIIRYTGCKNLGLISDDTGLYILWSFLDVDDVDVKPVLAQASLSVLPWGDSRLHNNIHPLAIPEKNAYLGVMHSHGEKGASGALFGGNYVHAFFLIENKPPFALLQHSSEFCIPALDSQASGKCETIQLILSVIRDPDDDGTLLISYGANDCEAAVTRVKLADVLDSMENNPEMSGLFKVSKVSKFENFPKLMAD